MPYWIRAAGVRPSAYAEEAMQPLVAIIMGSKSDWPTMEYAAKTLDALGVPYEVAVMSAHRTPQKVADYAVHAADRGLKIIIAGAGGAAHLAGVMAAYTTLPVLGVPMESKLMNGLDSLLSIVQMPAGVPVGTLAVGRAGAINAALLAASILALHDDNIRAAVEKYRSVRAQEVLEHPDPRVE